MRCIKWGFIQWADNQKQSRTGRPLNERESLYNNRTLRFWRLSTDYGRFIPDSEEEEGGDANDDDDDDGDAAYEIVNESECLYAGEA